MSGAYTMAVKPQWNRYLTSLADELVSQSNRVRDLIGDGHWLSDGHHKEYLLIGILSRHLPAGFIASRGFVIHPGRPDLRSREQDILIVDSAAEPPVFHQGNMVVAFPRQVKAAISVKSRLGLSEVQDSVAGLNEVTTLVASETDAQRIWSGIFAFEASDTVAKNPIIAYDYLEKAISASAPRNIASPVALSPGPNITCTARELVYVLDGVPEATEPKWRLRGFDCENIATALFLSSLLDHLAWTRGQAESDFSYFSDVNELTPLAVAERALFQATSSDSKQP
jgi:hypothetical protein